MVETVDSEKLADALNKAAERQTVVKLPLKVLIQINTSGEAEKSGIAPENCLKLFKHVKENCNALKVDGIMTIGEYGSTKIPNPDFLKLIECYEMISLQLGINPSEFEISMGMSTDFEHAVELGSTIVRVGSSIFGERDYSKA